MRVITGTARGRKLITLEGEEIRPTSDMVKEAMFSSIQFEIDGARVLDLFCGSGQLGIEALSRGAKECRFVDKSADSLNCAKENVTNCRMNTQSSFTQSDSLDFLRMARMTFDIAFLDPPYRMGLIEKVLPLLADKMSERGIIICEHERGLELPEKAGELVKGRTHRYGKIETTVYRMPMTEQ
ncbi:MAG: 16S rRNA (guanine(966)-N(2))-methyltransferase RsmD [Oscillospiraceae bacterium]|nr:16S rRNA (guanine(966)-N(2))-methyltransferase RsmD [Oscillospiraceae bacterium]